MAIQRSFYRDYPRAWLEGNDKVFYAFGIICFMMLIFSLLRLKKANNAIPLYRRVIWPVTFLVGLVLSILIIVY